MTRLILNHPHTHAGRLYASGDALDVDLTTADWLIGQGVAQLEPEPPQAVATEPEPEPKAKSRPNSYPRQEPQA